MTNPNELAARLFVKTMLDTVAMRMQVQIMITEAQAEQAKSQADRDLWRLDKEAARLAAMRGRPTVRYEL